jgi:threonine-phosphate decarboxylase
MAGFSSQHGGNVREAAEKCGVDPETLLDFSANINPLGMPATLGRAIVNNLALAERYPDVEYQALHQALARHHAVPAEWVLAGNGETELIFNLVNWLKPRRALLLTPGFAEYRRALTGVGCQIEDYRLDEDQHWQPDNQLLGALHEQLDCLFLCTPNNPTGQLPDAQLVQQVVARCQTLQINLIVDEAFLDFAPQHPGLIPQLAQLPHVWVLRSLTKFFAIPGLRLGYLVHSNVDAVAAIRKGREPWTINAFAALAGEILFDDQHYIAATHQWLATAREKLRQGLAAIPALTVWPSCANYLFLRCNIPALDLQQALLAHGILIRHCANYPGLDSRYYRVAVKSELDNLRLITALQQVLSA